MNMKRANEIGFDIEYAGHDNEFKKSRLDGADDHPSRVLHIRGISQTVSEFDLALLCVPFGRITNMVYARKNNQALIELEDVFAAQRMVASLRNQPKELGGRTIIVQFSKHEQLSTKNDNQSVQTAIAQANLLSSKDGQISILDTQGSVVPLPLDMGKSRVLHIMIDDRFDDSVTHLFIYKVFSAFGRILRIIMFNKNNTEHCLVEYDNPSPAVNAKMSLNLKWLMKGRYQMRIEYSKLTALDVRQENERCRDFEKTPFSPVETYALNALSLVDHLVTDGPAILIYGYYASKGGLDGCRGLLILARIVGGVTSAVLSRFYLDLKYRNHWKDSLGMQDGSMGMNSGQQYVGHGYGSSQNNVNGAGASQVQAAISLLQQMASGGNTNISSLLASNPLLASTLGQNASGALSYMNSSGFDVGSGHTSQGNRVLIVSNLNEEKVDPDALFILFGVYGDVTRVKVMYNKKDTALIQFMDHRQATLARDNLNNLEVWGQPMKINVSKFNIIQMPKEGTDIGLTKDYMDSHLHRFKNPMSKNYKNIFPPGPVLHLSNIPLEADESDIRDLMENAGYKPQEFRFLVKEGSMKKMALVELPSTEDAIHALIDLHNKEITPTSHLRVSFSSKIKRNIMMQ